MRNYPVFTPIIGVNEKKYINDCLDTNWVSQGKYVAQFEESFSHFCECKFGIATANCTTALHLSCIALGLKEGDQVLVSSSTNMASAFSIKYTGAEPVPVDINRTNWQMNPNLIEPLINSNTKAIMVVHLFGHPVDMDPIIELAKKHNLKIIEDCAEAHGVKYKNRIVGSIGDVACFSFYSNKIITTGEGGMVVTNSESIAKTVRDYGNFCYGKDQKFMHGGIGFNYRMPNVSAAMGLGQLERIDEIFEKRQWIYDNYLSNLSDVQGLHIPIIEKWADTKMWMFNVHISNEFGITRNELKNKLGECDIEVREAFVPVNKQKVLIKEGFISENDCPEANYIMDHGFYLPSGLDLEEKDIKFISSKVKEFSLRT